MYCERPDPFHLFAIPDVISNTSTFLAMLFGTTEKDVMHEIQAGDIIMLKDQPQIYMVHRFVRYHEKYSVKFAT